MRRATSMPSQQFRHVLAHELERLQAIRVSTEHGILYSYMTTKDWHKKSSRVSSGFLRRFLMWKIA